MQERTRAIRMQAAGTTEQLQAGGIAAHLQEQRRWERGIQ